MQRLKDYAGFGLWLLGLGYIVSALSGHAVALPPAAQLGGVLAAVAAIVQLLLIALRRRQEAAAKDAAKPAIRYRQAEPTVTRSGARDHFGMRGVEPP
jgi:hypothetical protein